MEKKNTRQRVETGYFEGAYQDMTGQMFVGAVVQNYESHLGPDILFGSDDEDCNLSPAVRQVLMKPNPQKPMLVHIGWDPGEYFIGHVGFYKGLPFIIGGMGDPTTCAFGELCIRAEDKDKWSKLFPGLELY